MNDCIAAGDILRTRWSPDLQALYLGNGRFSGCFDSWGLMNEDATGPTSFLHKDYFGADAWGRGEWWETARLQFADAMPAPAQWRQHLSLYDGTLKTDASATEFRWSSLAAFSPRQRDLFLLSVQTKGQVSDLLLTPDAGTADRRATWTVVDAQPNMAVLRLTRMDAGCIIAIRLCGGGTLKTTQQGLRIALPEGSSQLILAMGGEARGGEITQEVLRAAPQQLLEESISAWHARWGEARLRLPNPTLQKTWARSVFWQLCGNAEEKSPPAPPCGLTAIKWRFPFPQDISCIHPALLRLGMLELVSGWVEYFRSHLHRQEEITTRIYRCAEDQTPAAGAMWAWEFPRAIAPLTPK